MEVAEALISSLYTNFILRDFVGKVVPGGLILFSMAILFSSPAKVVEFIKGSPIVVVALVGVSWTLMLGLQGFADMLGLQRALELTSIWTNLWRPVDESTYVVNLTQFRRSACPDDNLAYERFEVIYQACRNLLFAMIISIFPVAWYLWRKNPSSSVGTKKQCAPAVIWIR